MTGSAHAHCCLPPRPNPNDRAEIFFTGMDCDGFPETGHVLLLPGQTIGEWVAEKFAAEWLRLSVYRPGAALPCAEIRDGRIVWAEQ